jgi:hypothetical protein
MFTPPVTMKRRQLLALCGLAALLPARGDESSSADLRLNTLVAAVIAPIIAAFSSCSATSSKG